MVKVPLEPIPEWYTPEMCKEILEGLADVSDIKRWNRAHDLACQLPDYMQVNFMYPHVMKVDTHD